MKRLISLAAAAAAGTTVLVGVGVTSASATTNTCDVKAWGNGVNGRPANFDDHRKGGDYLWHDKAGFHLRVTHKRDDKRVYSGVITASTKIISLRRVKFERRDKVWLSADHKSLYFRFVNHGWVDGINFRTACATTLTVSSLKVGTTALPASRVYLGRHRAHPAAVPFTVSRKA
jgi:hypothetical protein